MFTLAFKVGTDFKEERMNDRACFTGHRPDKLEAAGERPLAEVSFLLRAEIISAVNSGITTFISGMCPGIDILAAEEVIKLRATDSRIKLIAAMPYPRFAFNWEGWGIRVESALARADFVKYVSSTYTGKGVFQKRNKWMVDHSTRLIAYWNGTPGGTRNTVVAAQATGIEVVNCYSKSILRGDKAGAYWYASDGIHFKTCDIGEAVEFVKRAKERNVSAYAKAEIDGRIVTVASSYIKAVL